MVIYWAILVMVSMALKRRKKQIIDGAIWLMVDIALEKEDAGLKVETITTTTTTDRLKS